MTCDVSAHRMAEAAFTFDLLKPRQNEGGRILLCVSAPLPSEGVSCNVNT